ncbi:MAG: hypothetical protein AAFR68_04055, partial [Pseudomonadota bacterium]
DALNDVFTQIDSAEIDVPGHPVFLQAYLPVVVLTNYHRYGVLPGNNINSGPGFVTADGLEKVEEFAGEYR